ncbi:helix-turn-helix transcriptional regulator [Adlercreutzia aquisgranensis]|uniref:helix-turn-helix transcriptional regulator n=1 Tax=Adlercreutzia aquisgranensis TaxID=2941323 RepID=UPI0020414770|nr:LuxR C-terminal-related transcriptional regulator [Adlercreutzia aquisgranensis]
MREGTMTGRAGSANARGGISLNLFGFSFWQAWWILAMCSDIALPQRSHSGTLFNAFFCITILTTMGYLAVVLAGRKFGPFSANPRCFALAGGLGSAGALCLVLFTAFVYSGSLDALFFLGAVLFSAGNALLLIMWGELWSTLATGRVGRYLYASYAFAFVLYFLVTALPQLVGGLVMSAFPVISVLILRSCRTEEKRSPSQIDFEIESLSPARIVVALVALGAVHGFTQRYLNVSGTVPAETMSYSLLIAGAMLVVLVLYLIVRQPAVEVLSLYVPIVPAFVIGLVLLSQLPASLAFAGNGLVLLAIFSTDILVMIVSTDIAFRTRRPVAICFGLALFCMRLGTTIASASVYVLLTDGALAPSTRPAAFLVGAIIVVLVGSVVFTPTDLAKLYQPRQTGEPDSASTSNCARIAEACGLTPRETEVLALLSAGRSAPYISNELCIAESTTKHHISSIYRKIGVCDRQDLMDVLHRGIAGKGAV